MMFYLDIVIFFLPVLAVLITPFLSRTNQQAYYIPFGISALALPITYWHDPNESQVTIIIISIGGATLAGMMSVLVYHIKRFLKNRKLAEGDIGVSIVKEKPIALLILPPILLGTSIYMFMLTFSQWDVPSEMLERLGVTENSMVIELSFLSFYYLALSVGLWTGTRWGWWIAGVFCFYRSLIAIKSMVFLNSFFFDYTLEDADISKFMWKSAVRLVFYGFCIAYLYRPIVIKHFGITVNSKKRNLLLMLTSSIVIVFCAFVLHSAMSMF